jgi:hypothetical protein
VLDSDLCLFSNSNMKHIYLVFKEFGILNWKMLRTNWTKKQSGFCSKHKNIEISELKWEICGEAMVCSSTSNVEWLKY